MTANIAIVQGEAQAWYADKPAWHNLGTVTAGARTAAEVMEAVPLFSRRIELADVFVAINGAATRATHFRATVREGDDAPLAIVSDEYEVLQDSDGLLTLEALVQQVEDETAIVPAFVSAFGLGNGAQCVATIDLSQVVDLTIERDPSRHEGYLFGTWSHDGTGSLRAGLYDMRVDCQNMTNAALSYSANAGTLVRIRHTGDVGERLIEARQVLGFTRKAAQAYVEEMNALAALPLKAKYLDLFLVELIPIPEDMERPRAREEAREVIRSLYENADNLNGVPESPYRLLQAVTEYADHWRPLRIGLDDERTVNERRFRSITEGPAARTKAEALDILRRDFLVPVRVGR